MLSSVANVYVSAYDDANIGNSAVAAGTPSQVEQVMRSPLLATVIERLENDEFDVKKEAAWVLANILHGFASDVSYLHCTNSTR